MYTPYLFACLMACISCNQTQQNITDNITASPQMSHTIGEIPLPQGYVRVPATPNSFTAYSRGITLKKDNTVYLFNGTKKGNQTAQYAVLNIDVGNKDLQQCADAVMRLRAEYLFALQDYKDISFRFTNGFHCDFEHYAAGYRVVFRTNGCTWVKQSGADYSHATLRKYLDLVYAYAGTKSLYAQMDAVPFTAITSGKVLLQKREGYGHAVTVMDMAYNPKTNDTIFLLCQSYMPAQDIHILQNPMNKGLSPWYSTHFNGDLQTPEWTFTKSDLKTF